MVAGYLYLKGHRGKICFNHQLPVTSLRVGAAQLPSLAPENNALGIHFGLRLHAARLSGSVRSNFTLA